MKNTTGSFVPFVFTQKQLSPSTFLNDIKNQNVIEFDKYPKDFYSKLLLKRFETLPMIDNHPILQNYKKYLDVIENTSYDKLFVSSPSEVSIFLEYIKSRLIPKINIPIATFWPPFIRFADPNFELFYHFLIKMVHESKQPLKVLYWLSVAVFPSVFTKPTRPPIFAACKCIIPKRKGSFWALIDADGLFHLYTITKGVMVEDLKAQMLKIRVASDMKTIEVLGQKDMIVSSFQPIDPAQVELWAKVFDKSRPPFPVYITSFSLPMPDLYYAGVNHFIACSDATAAKALLDHNISNPSTSEGHNLVKSLVDVFSYASKINSIINTIISQSMESPDFLLAKVLYEPSHMTNLFKILCNDYCGGYINDFLLKIIRYIDSKGDILILDSTNLPNFTVVFFSVIKYILSSASLIPPQIIHFLSVLRSYLCLRINDRSVVYEILSSYFLKGFVCEIIKAPETVLPTGQKLTHPQVFPVFSNLLYEAFSMSEFANVNPLLLQWQSRLNSHVYPKLEEFCYSISVLDADVTYDIPSAERLAKSLEDIMKTIGGHHEKFVEKYSIINSLENERHLPTLIGWNFATALSSFFKHCWDQNEPAQEIDEEIIEEESQLEVMIPSDERNSNSIEENDIVLESPKIVQPPSQVLPIEESDSESPDSQDSKDDKAESPEKPKSHRHKRRLVKAELSPNKENGIVRKIVRRDPNEEVDPSQPKRKYYKRVVKHVPRSEVYGK